VSASEQSFAEQIGGDHGQTVARFPWARFPGSPSRGRNGVDGGEHRFPFLGGPRNVVNVNTVLLGFPTDHVSERLVGAGIPGAVLAVVLWAAINTLYVWAAIRMTTRGPRLLGWAMMAAYAASVCVYMDLSDLMF
jgi:hypothetical protein